MVRWKKTDWRRIQGRKPAWKARKSYRRNNAAKHAKAAFEKEIWRATTAEARGLGHIEVGLPCQDRTASFDKNGISVICLADGAGSSVKSQYGAEAVVKGIGEFFVAHYDEVIGQEDHELAIELEDVVRHILQKTASERHCDFQELASTILAVAVGSENYVTIHVGDGVIGAVDIKAPKVLSLPWNGEYSNITTFTTGANLASNIRITKGTVENVSGFILMSDGAAESLHYHGTKKLAPAVIKLMLYCDEHPEDVDEQLQETLDLQLTQRTVDDCSVALLVKAGSASMLKKSLDNIPEDWAPATDGFGE